jgi:hypothetical protein
VPSFNPSNAADRVLRHSPASRRTMASFVSRLAILPIVFKEDPRYFRLGSGTYTHCFLYSAATTVGVGVTMVHGGQNYANVLGKFISGGISNAYYPAAERGFGQTVDGALTVTAEGIVGAEFVEFWPDIETSRSTRWRSDERGCLEVDGGVLLNC